jgi:Winged helix DNA-binding domain
LGRTAPDVETALRDVVGVYSAHPSAPLSLYARTRGFEPDAFRALDAEPAALRLPCMRASIYLLPRDTAHLPFCALPEPEARRDQRWKHFGVTADEYAALRDAVLAAAQRPRTPAELRTRTGEGDKRLKGAMATMTREGTLLRVGAESLRSNALRYVAADAWLEAKRGLPDADPDDALAWLAGEYLRAFGPASTEDVQWWTGASAGRTAAALDQHELVEVGDGLLLLASDAAGFEAAEPPARDAIDLLPKWDCYTMGYAPEGRARLMHRDVQEHCYDHRGDGRGLVLRGGEAVGAWDGRFAGKRLEVSLNMFDAPAAGVKKAIEVEFAAVGELLGAKAVSFK